MKRAAVAFNVALIATSLALLYVYGPGACGIRRLYGYVDRAGRLRIPIQYREARPFHDGMAAVRTGDAWGYIDTAGDMKIEPRFTSADDFSQGLAVVGQSCASWLTW